MARKKGELEVLENTGEVFMVIIKMKATEIYQIERQHKIVKTEYYIYIHRSIYTYIHTYT